MSTKVSARQTPALTPRPHIITHCALPLAHDLRLQKLHIITAWLDLGGTINATCPNGSSPLHYAMLAPYDEAIDLLLTRGADVDQRLPNGSTPLLLASIRALAPVVSKLLMAGADPNIPDADGHTPLMVAARAGWVDILRELLQAGAKLEPRDAQKRTALWYARMHSPLSSSPLATHLF